MDNSSRLDVLVANLKSRNWEHVRTCSHVSGNPCTMCGGETYYGRWISRNADRTLTLCEACHKTVFEPEKAVAEAEAKKEAKKQRDDLIEDEKRRRKNNEPPPAGWKRKNNLLTATKPTYIFGNPYYEIIEVYPTLFDTETIKPDANPVSFNFFKIEEKKA